MSTVSQDLAAFVSDISAGDFDSETVEKSKELLVDTIGCSIGAFTSPPVKSLRETFAGSAGADDATVVGTRETAAVADAALVNATMARYLDYNDCYMAASAACHPSDHIMALLSIAEAEGATGTDLIEAIVTAYEVEARGLDECPVRVNGFDYAAWGVYSSVASAGTLMGLSEDELVDAFGIAGASNNPLYISRRGEVSMWKGVAHPYVTHNAIQACQMARNGLGGPAAVFEGPFGFYEVVADGEIAFDRPPRPGEHRILETSLKSFACGYYIHSPITGALELLDEHDIAPDDVDAVHVETFDVAVEALATPEKWDKDLTRETADHSIPYSVAAAIVDGEVTPAQYAEDRLRAPEIHAMMDRITAEENEDLTAHREDHPRHIPSITRVTVDGEEYSTRVDSPLGHPERPMSEEEVVAKFEDNCRPLLSADQIEACLDACDSLDALDRVDPVLDPLVV